MPNAICNYPLRGCSTTGGGWQPSEHDIEDSMDIGENGNAVIILPLLCSLWHIGGGQFLFPVSVFGMISLFYSVSGGYMHKSICNSMLLGLNAFYEWGQCFLSEPWYDDPVSDCFGSPVCVNGSVIPDCKALRLFFYQYCGKHFVADENFFDEIVLRYFGWTPSREFGERWMLRKDMGDQHFQIGLQFKFAPCESTPHKSWRIWLNKQTRIYEFCY